MPPVPASPLVVDSPHPVAEPWLYSDASDSPVAPAAHDMREQFSLCQRKAPS